MLLLNGWSVAGVADELADDFFGLGLDDDRVGGRLGMVTTTLPGFSSTCWGDSGCCGVENAARVFWRKAADRKLYCFCERPKKSRPASRRACSPADNRSRWAPSRNGRPAACSALANSRTSLRAHRCCSKVTPDAMPPTYATRRQSPSSWAFISRTSRKARGTTTRMEPRSRGSTKKSTFPRPSLARSSARVSLL